MDKERIIEAIRNLTNGTWLSDDYTSTCMGWVRKYDTRGRVVNPDPNYKDCQAYIGNKLYKWTKHGWDVFIWKLGVDASYLNCMSEDIDQYLLTKVDITPDYVKEYQKNMSEDTCW
jgi:hypothetical protein